MANTKVAFLYTEIAGYFLACAQELSKSADVLIVRWPVNKEAPFNFGDITNIRLEDRDQFNDDQLIKLLQEFSPDILVCSGWVDKGYLKAVKSFGRKIPCVMSLDNHWTGSLKQRIATLISPIYLKKIFTHAWVPGEVQAKYARKLGFAGNILLNFYCADVPLFEAKYQRTFEQKQKDFPKRFLYVARYVEHKGIFEMWEAFKLLQDETPNEWELWCLGTGDQWENRVEHEKIRHVGFVQPEDMDEYIAQTSVYILPSKFEPWGVTTQEFAICGFPLLLSDAIGSKEKYLKDNGFEFKAGSIEEIKLAMKKIVEMDEDELITMGQLSHEIGVSFTPDMWVQNLLQLISEG